MIKATNLNGRHHKNTTFCTIFSDIFLTASVSLRNDNLKRCSFISLIKNPQSDTFSTVSVTKRNVRVVDDEWFLC